MNIKKTNKKPVALVFLALILCLALFFSACNKGNAPADTNANMEATASPETNITPEPQNYGSFTVVIPDNGKYSIATENDFVKQAIINDIVKEKGIQVDMNVLPLDASDYFNQINATIASGQSIECIVDDYSMFDVYMGIPDLCLPVDDLLSQYGQGLLNSISSETWNAVTYNGMTYAVPGEALPEETAMYVRQDLLDLMGLNKIVTRQEFDAALFAFSTLKPMGITPLAINYQQALDYMTYLRRVPANDYTYEYGKYVLREQHSYFKDFLEMLKDYYENGYIPEDFFDITEEQVTTLFTSGLAMMYVTEYTDVAEDYQQLLSVAPDADVELVTKPTHRRMPYVQLSGETPVSDICIFTSYGQNHAALMVYLDWMLSDVENYETANLGILGTQINFINLTHQYQLIGDYEQKPDYYNSIYRLGISHDGVYPPVVPINGDATAIKCLGLELSSYEHLSTADVVDEGTYNLSPEAQSALSYYRYSMDEAIRRYVTGEITIAEYMQYFENNKENAKIVIDELNTFAPNGSRQ